jgi:DNA polymerase-1
VTALVVDGQNILWRAVYARSSLEMKRSDGFPTGIAVAFARALINIDGMYRPESGVVIFDGPGPNFRRLLAPDYKGNREREVPPGFLEQIPVVRRLVGAFGFLLLDSEPYEADDLIGSVVRKWSRDRDVLILSDDKDLGCLTGPRVRQHRPCDAPRSNAPHPVVDEAVVEKRWGVKPRRVPDVQALSGDGIDNIGGMPGVGPIGARDLVNKHGSAERVALAMGGFPGKRWSGFAGASHNMRIMTAMTRLVCDVPFRDDEVAPRGRDWPTRVASILLALEATSAVTQLARRHSLDLSRIRPDSALAAKRQKRTLTSR